MLDVDLTGDLEGLLDGLLAEYGCVTDEELLLELYVDEADTELDEYG